MAVHAPITGTRLCAPISFIQIQRRLTAECRQAIGDEIERLLALLDIIDGDCDLEPEDDMCAAGDDGCGYFSCGSVSGWGSIAEATLPTIPQYGADQSEGPIDYELKSEIYKLHQHRREYELAGMTEQANKIAARLAALDTLP